MTDRNQPDAPHDPKSTDSGTRIVDACPECNRAGGLRPHGDGGSYNANNQQAYDRTDYTCKKCGAYLNDDDINRRPAKSPHNKGALVDAAQLLARDDITTFQEAREAARARADGGNTEENK